MFDTNFLFLYRLLLAIFSTSKVCFQRSSSTKQVPGCSGDDYVKTSSDHDYCTEKENRETFNYDYLKTNDGGPELYGVDVKQCKKC
jgi:hypothetical protein